MPAFRWAIHSARMGENTPLEGRMAKNTPHGDHTMGALFAPSFHRPWLRYIEPVDGGEGGSPPPEPKPEDDPTDWKSEARKHEARSKEWAAKARANEEAARRLTEIEEANKSETEKANARAEAAEKRAAEAEAKAIRAEIAAEKNVPASLLVGSTREEMEAIADELVKFRGEQKPAPQPPKYVIPDVGGVPTGGKPESLRPGIGTLRAAYAESSEGK